MNVARDLKFHNLFLSFLLLSRTTSVQKLFFVHYGRYGYSVTFWIWVVSRLSRRHGNHEPQRFDFRIECKLGDGNCQFYFSHNKNIQFSIFCIKEGGAFLKSPSILELFKNLCRLWVLRICFSQIFQDTFNTRIAHLGTRMVELMKPSCQAKAGAQKQFFIWIIDWMLL